MNVGIRLLAAMYAGGALLLTAALGASPRDAGMPAAEHPVRPTGKSGAEAVTHKPTGKLSATATQRVPGRAGDAWSDPTNPIVQIFHGKRLDLWSLQKPKTISLPTVRDKAWPKTPVDRFILAGLEAAKLTPSREADRRTLIRRLYFDLIGLPPTPEETRAFAADTSPNAYDKLVERLLSSKHYGERWGRHWLDVVRYADTNGFERDEFRPNTYRYRDYVIRAFNTDKPYNRFIREQLAGDEIVDSYRPSTPQEIDTLIATGFMRLGQYDSTGSIFEENKRGRDQLMADLANTTGSAFLGLTVACANCHDHKYDPISQADHFRLRAFFAGVTYRDDIWADAPPVRAEIETQNAAVNAQIETAEKTLAALLAPIKQQIADTRRAAFPADVQELLKMDEAKRDDAANAKLKPFLEKLNISDGAALKKLPEADRKRPEELTKQVEAWKKQLRTHETMLAMTDAGPKAPPTAVFAQGDFQQPKGEVQPGFLSVFDPNPAVIRPTPSGKSSGRRTALANWIASPDNPLTARVLVNRLWQNHFGVGLVKTPNDFGYSGSRPTNQPLLDWLAKEFVRGGWSIKHVQRLITLSAAYRQASSVDPKRRASDPDNAHFWRQNMRRHDAETLRDSLLAVSGLLLPVDSGPPRWPPVPQDLLDAQPSILETHSDAAARERREGWYADPVEQTDARTVFLIQKRCLSVPFLQPFDLQDTAISCAARTNTTVAPQALTLLNNDLTLRAARAFATRVVRESGEIPEKQIRRAVWLALSREPDKEEMAIARNLLTQHARKHAQTAPQDGKTQGDKAKDGRETAQQDSRQKDARETPARAALTDLCRMLLNVNEFVYVD